MTDKEQKSPVREYRVITDDGGDPGYINRILIGTAVTGLIRYEWAVSRYHQTIPVNWAQVEHNEMMNTYYPYRYLVADAQNLIVKLAVEKDFEWLLLWEHDVIPPQDAILKLNKYIVDEQVPVVSGLYYTRGRPSEPLVFRGKGNHIYQKWELGDLVWCDGVPTGFLLIHMGLIREMWEDSPEYLARNIVTRRVFETPRGQWYDEVHNRINTLSGTSDLHWCNRVIKEKYLEKAGWKKIARKRYPFLVDTNLFCRHINQDGEHFP
jgi:hypothetical protein